MSRALEVDQSSSQTRSRCGPNKQCASRTARIPACLAPMKKRRPKPPRGSRSRCRCYSRPDSANEYGVPWPTMR
jgi:hypothetical protein